VNAPEAAALDFLREHPDWSVLLNENGQFLGLAAPDTQWYWEWYWTRFQDGEIN